MSSDIAEILDFMDAYAERMSPPEEVEVKPQKLSAAHIGSY